MIKEIHKSSKSTEHTNLILKPQSFDFKFFAFPIITTLTASVWNIFLMGGFIVEIIPKD